MENDSKICCDTTGFANFFWLQNLLLVEKLFKIVGPCNKNPSSRWNLVASLHLKKRLRLSKQPSYLCGVETCIYSQAKCQISLIPGRIVENPVVQRQQEKMRICQILPLAKVRNDYTGLKVLMLRLFTLATAGYISKIFRNTCGIEVVDGKL